MQDIFKISLDFKSTPENLYIIASKINHSGINNPPLLPLVNDNSYHPYDYIKNDSNMFLSHSKISQSENNSFTEDFFFAHNNLAN